MPPRSDEFGARNPRLTLNVALMCLVMLTAVHDDDTILASLQAGADGYLTKDRAAREVVAGLAEAGGAGVVAQLGALLAGVGAEPIGPATSWPRWRRR